MKLKKRRENMDTFIKVEDDFVRAIERCLLYCEPSELENILYVNGQYCNES